jgi:hypothetical protein
VCAVAPSCWNHRDAFPSSLSLGSRKLRNIST